MDVLAGCAGIRVFQLTYSRHCVGFAMGYGALQAVFVVYGVDVKG